MRVVVAWFLLAATVWADDSLRCGERLVHLGEYEAAVGDKCGPPTHAERHYIESGGDVPGHITIDIWVYDRGPGEFVRILRFDDGVLRYIEPGEYGHAR